MSTGAAPASSGSSASVFAPSSCGQLLDDSPEAFGELYDASHLSGDGPALRARMAADGYIFLRGGLHRDEVLAARREIVGRLAAAGELDPSRPVMDAVAGGSGRNFNPDVAAHNPALEHVLYDGPMMAFHEQLLGGPVRHFDFTWLRTVRPGPGTRPHCDVVYMGRGTHRLYTSWVPLGDIPREIGGLMILEHSHRQAERLRTYLSRDVDAYCTNRPDAPAIESGRKQWQDWDGTLSKNPVSLRAKLGGRWLTADFRAGDLLTFGMATIHASLDNHSDRVRLSSDSRYQLASDSVDERWVGENPVAHGVAGKRGRVC